MPTLSIGLRKNWLRYFQYDEGKGDTTTETRNILLIIFTLVTAVTFQAGVNPPDIQAYYVFLIFNTLAFSNSILVILSLTHKFPFYFEIWVGTVSMAVTYGSAIIAVSPKETISLRYARITAAGPFVVRLLVLIFNLFFGKHFNRNNVPLSSTDEIAADRNRVGDAGEDPVRFRI
ncbi:hypothetical protein E2542_SST08160 [Spatholobus suberectus]|nr:hypothetical protein E2542_SST08160 [Spatholobus suberectus]